MLLRVVPMFGFGILRIFRGNRKNEENWEIWAKIGFLHYSVGNPRHGVDLRQGVGYPGGGKAEVPKWHPLGYAATKGYVVA